MPAAIAAAAAPSNASVTGPDIFFDSAPAFDVNDCAFFSAAVIAPVNCVVFAVTTALIFATVVPAAIIVSVLSLAVAPAHAPNTQSGTERSIR